MSATLVDSNVLLDLVESDPVWANWSSQVLAEAGNSSRLVINPIIFAEVSVGFETVEDLKQALPLTLVQREPLPYEAAFLAGKVFRDYRRRGGERRSPLPDFFIGAHATVAGYVLLTRDPRRYRKDFPNLRLIAPH